MIKAPCYECLNRSPNCHAKCEGYIAWRTRIRELKAKHYGLKMVDGFIRDGAAKSRGWRKEL